MNTALNPRSPWQAWKSFWFHPSDPTTLGFIRICTGLLVLYIHIAYSVDLQSFFGKNAWNAIDFIDRERHETPTYATTWSWDDQLVIPQLSEYPHRRQAMMGFLRDRKPDAKTGLPADPAQRARAMRYLNRVNRYENPLDFQQAMHYFLWIGTRPEARISLPGQKPRLELDVAERERYLTALTGGKVEFTHQTTDGKSVTEDRTAKYLHHTPQSFRNLSPAEQAELADEIRAFWAVLPNEDEDAWKYVLFHFIEPGLELRRAMIEYINTLPTDKTERDALLDYLEYWNRDPRKAIRTGASIFSVWFHVTDPTQMALIHTGVLFVMVLFTIGLFTRVTSVLTWIAAVGYIHRTQQILFGMDTMMNILLLYLMVGNSGAALSVDRLIARYRAARASLRRSGTIDANTRAFLACPPPSIGAGFGLRLIQVHFCFIYMAAGLSKLKGGAWWDGRAFWDVVVNPEFTPMVYPWFETTLRNMVSWKPAYQFMIATGCWATLFIEIAAPFLLWTRLRWFMVLAATAMHALIGVIMGLNLFELLMIIMLASFFPDRVIRDRFRGSSDLPRYTMTVDPEKPAQARAASLAVALDVDNQVTVKPVKNAGAPGLDSPEKPALTGPAAASVLLRGLRLLSGVWLLLAIPGVRGWLGRRLFPTTTA